MLSGDLHTGGGGRPWGTSSAASGRAAVLRALLSRARVCCGLLQCACHSAVLRKCTRHSSQCSGACSELRVEAASQPPEAAGSDEAHGVPKEAEDGSRSEPPEAGSSATCFFFALDGDSWGEAREQVVAPSRPHGMGEQVSAWTRATSCAS